MKHRNYLGILLVCLALSIGGCEERPFEDGEEPLQEDINWIVTALHSNKPAEPTPKDGAAQRLR